MSLSKKEMKHYKPLVLAKLAEMGVKNEIGYTQTGTTKLVHKLNNEDEENPKIETERVPNYRATNLYKNLTKKLLGMSKESLEKFLNTSIDNKKTGEKNGQATEG